ncbi:MAG: hypothetical protein F6K53_20160 [Moorea sp. SIO4A1]|uniref:hypothetical protein n=1 Tax=Moorena sp. SIO4A1 TaxID=2607835 RepID=UPI001418B178|nr:hypothetical protein [Moorena sp. SIO4A1]NEO43284.1 hypothetical protein [Moorena sp. SIO4A3]NEQ59586.1 hypothetical protein [Moorena sp. SIO4A1]
MGTTVMYSTLRNLEVGIIFRFPEFDSILQEIEGECPYEIGDVIEFYDSIAGQDHQMHRFLTTDQFRVTNVSARNLYFGHTNRKRYTVSLSKIDPSDSLLHTFIDEHGKWRHPEQIEGFGLDQENLWWIKLGPLGELKPDEVLTAKVSVLAKNLSEHVPGRKLTYDSAIAYICKLREVLRNWS